MLQNLSFRGVMISVIVLAASLKSFSQNRSEEYRQKVLANQKVSSVIMSEHRETPTFISLKNNAPTYSKAQLKPAIESFLSVRAGIDQTVQDEETKTGMNEVVEFQQYYKGVKVDRAKFKAFLKNGQAEFFNGAWYAVPATLSTAPALSRDQALGFAKARIGAKRYMPDVIIDELNSTLVASRRAMLQAELQEASYDGELVIIKDFDNSAPAAEVRLAYKFNMYAVEPLSRSWVYVDANNGKILLIDKIIKHVGEEPSALSVSTVVQTRYSGSRNIFVKQISGNDPQNGLPLVASNPLEGYVPGSPTYVLIDDTRGNGVETYDLNGVGGLPLNVAAFYSQAKSFTDVNNNWLLSEHKRGEAVESENDDFAWDAHWGAGVVYDYWKNIHGRLSYDGNDAKIKSFIHSGLAFDNAFWNGSVMTYGDGSGTAANGFKPLTSLDVCGHEIGHGVCEFTSDLVYARESGAMNEGFSDIWGAAVEYFAIKTLDPGLSAAYNPFYIGEQISVNPATPLRRMDNPKSRRDPDTYGGEFWTSQIGCSPTLANDQCGVHNNSGVLNKWFYLMTVGSGAGSGPDAIYAGQDDGINDAVTTGPVEMQHPANPYQVTGLGFAVGERIAYLTELLLTTTATFAEAREVSIQVATEISGNPCSATVESVTNAWYAVGVGPKFVKPCTITYGFVTRNGSAVSENTPSNGCSASKTFNIPVVLPPNSNASVSLSGTASTLDYSLSTTSLSNTTALIAKKDFIVTIKNDGAVEGDEFAQLALTVSNIGTNPVNNAYRLTILDDDVVPVIGVGQKTLLTETFTRADGFADPAGWTEILEVPEAATGDPTGSGKNQWGIFDNKLAITGKEGTTGTQQPGGTYNSNSPSQTIIKSPLLDARGLSVVTLAFDYTVQGELDVTAVDDPENLPVFDYMAVAYSIDGVNFVELNSGAFRQFASVQPTSGSITGLLPASLANKQFYLAFRWFNDTNAGGPISASIDNVTVTAAPRTLENDLGHNGRENLSPSQEVYFYSVQDGQVLSKIRNESARDFGCTNVSVEKTGSGAFNLYQNNQGLHKVADKIIRIESAISSKSPTTVTLFYTESQLQGLESATGRPRDQFAVYQVQGISYTAATSSNTKRYTAVYTAIPGVGGSYTVSFNDRANGSYALGAQVTLFARFEESKQEQGRLDWNFQNVSPNPMQSSGFIEVNAPSAQRINMNIVTELRQHVATRSITVPKGVFKIPIPATSLRPGKYVVTLSDEKGVILNSQAFFKY